MVPPDVLFDGPIWGRYKAKTIPYILKGTTNENIEGRITEINIRRLKSTVLRHFIPCSYGGRPRLGARDERIRYSTGIWTDHHWNTFSTERSVEIIQTTGCCNDEPEPKQRHVVTWFSGATSQSMLPTLLNAILRLFKRIRSHRARFNNAEVAHEVDKQSFVGLEWHKWRGEETAEDIWSWMLDNSPPKAQLNC